MWSLRRRSQRRPWPIRRYFVLLFVLALVAAIAAGLFVSTLADRDARREARQEALFSATVAAEQLGKHIALVRATTAQLAANPQIEQVLATPEGCTLTFEGLVASDASHLDILRPDGTVACSSQKITPEAAQTGYGGSSWLRRGLTEPVFVAPVTDELGGGQVAIATAPLAGKKGLVAGFVDVTSIGPGLAGQYGGGRETVFLVTTADGRTVISRSLASKRWSGRDLTEDQRHALSDFDRVDLDGTERLYAHAPVPGVGWSFHVGEKKSEVLAAVHRLRARQLQLIVLGLTVFLLAAALVYRQVVSPIRRLSSAVREANPGEPGAAVPVCGPAEVNGLGQDVNSLIDSVQTELIERRRAEQVAQASEESYRLLFEGNPSALWVYDSESLRFLAVNDAAVDTYGYSRDEFLSMSIDEIRSGSEADRLHADIGSAAPEAARGFRNAGVWQHRRKDGTTLDVEITSHDHRFDGRPARVVMALDVTERVRAEEALRRSEARYRDLFENASDLISAADLDGRLTAVNEAFVRATGYSREELIGMPLEDLVPAEHRERLREARERKLDGTTTTLYQHELLARDGRRIPVEVASRLIEEDGRPIGTEAIGRDVGERLQLEEQLRQAQRLEAVGRLAGGVAHDFNNVLTVIGGYTEALLSRGDHDSDEELEQIAAATERATSLTRQLLAFSRQQVLQPQAVLLNDVVEGLMPMLTRLIGEDVELVAALAPGVDPVLADAGQLEQVLVNLAVNARHAMPDGGRLTIETANVELDEAYVAHHGDARVGPHVMVSVADDGSGMDAETLAHAFEPFYTTKPVGVGTGLGLATVYGIVKQSGGNVWVYSEPGKGTTIKIYLPTTDANVQTQNDTPTPDAADGEETILLAEDEESLRKLITLLLTQRGYDVITAETPTDVLRIARESDRIDLLLTDLVMPEISGRALAEQVSKVAPGIRVLFMSGYSDDAVTRNGSLEPGAAFLEKPFTGHALAAKVRETLGAGR